MLDKMPLSVKIAFYMDIYRVIPRLVVLTYFATVLYMAFWAMGLPVLSGTVTALISVYTAMFSGVSAFYMNTGFDWKGFLKDIKELKDDTTNNS